MLNLVQIIFFHDQRAIAVDKYSFRFICLRGELWGICRSRARRLEGVSPEGIILILIVILILAPQTLSFSTKVIRTEYRCAPHPRLEMD